MKFALTIMVFFSFNFAFSFDLDEISIGFGSWEKVKIPGARCGNGTNYTVFLKKKSEKKLLVEFMGGGACWDKKSCITLPYTWIYPMIELPSFSILTSATNLENPFIDHSFVYFPFCTGDVFTGDRISNYDGSKVYHYGYRNIILALEYLSKNSIIEFNKVDDLVVWGASAGGIGALTHAKNIENYVAPNATKILIADSPGLHFGPTFWDKFAQDAKNDFKSAFNKVRLDVDFNDGFVARKIGPVLEHYRGWHIGFLYAMKDRIMSNFFGEISKEDHKKLLLSSEGLPAIAKNYPYVHVWIADSDIHRFLLTSKPSHVKSVDGVTAIHFARGISKSIY